jgi:hypothetical protein
LILAAVAIGAIACDPSHAVTYDNRTNNSVMIFINGAFDGSVDPMDEKTLEVIEFDEATFEARDSDGRVIYSETFTWEELKDAGWRIVITEPTSTPSDGRSSHVRKRP